ncbi:winged helix-turn-helix transcriptional regulator [Streptomyces sp. RGM 3693]|uniref:winged helix-turn-helix transcriptional regulator n=1 Tax=Streptomyces sp. RGM 3693 TaxID=3413284 RepID=UPI003D2C12AF
MNEWKGPYECGLDAAVDVIGGKWKVLLLWALSQGPRRFGQLRRELPKISEKVLAQQLRELEADGIVHREVFDQIPPKVEYSFTELGASLNEALAPLGAWGRLHLAYLEATYAQRHPDAQDHPDAQHAPDAV